MTATLDQQSQQLALPLINLRQQAPSSGRSFGEDERLPNDTAQSALYQQPNSTPGTRTEFGIERATCACKEFGSEVDPICWTEKPGR